MTGGLYLIYHLSLPLKPKTVQNYCWSKEPQNKAPPPNGKTSNHKGVRKEGSQQEGPSNCLFFYAVYWIIKILRGLRGNCNCWIQGLSRLFVQKSLALKFSNIFPNICLKEHFKQSPDQQFEWSVVPAGVGVGRTISHTCCQVIQPAASCALTLHPTPSESPPCRSSPLGESTAFPELP